MSVKIQPPDDPYRKLKANGVKPLAERPTHEELVRRLSKLRPLKLTETPEHTIRAMRDGR